jgi:PIN domain nuclease of toxin-antitoxin system
VKYIVDTHLLLWAASGKVKQKARVILSDESNQLIFSSAAIWEVAIKNGLGKKEFRYEPQILLNGLLSVGYEELPVSSKHILLLTSLSQIHKDPFDRIMIAQTIAEGCCFLTSDKTLEGYGDFVILV